ncbi:MAG: hypothetical protein QNJ62_12975 [Methyloceanibacter sp.]|nr:hypothetical protein [Methyloceanibacter sp.]
MGPQQDWQIISVLGGTDGDYDDSDGVLAWIVQYWVRAWVKMARLTGDRSYMDSCVSFIDAMFAHTDERRIERGEIQESYIREPGYFRGTGVGGPFWKAGGLADVVTNGQIAQGILCFVELVFEDPRRWRRYRALAQRYFEDALTVIDVFDNDWQTVRSKGSYHYRDSEGSGVLGVTSIAFNQAASMMTAQVLVNKLEPSPARIDKIRRLVQLWLDDYMVERPDGTVSWRYIANHPEQTNPEDVGHGSIDIEFLVAAYLTGETALDERHMVALAKTFTSRVYNGHLGLNEFVDGSTEPRFDENWNAAIGWIELARWDPEVFVVAARIYNTSYPPIAPSGVLWSRPMLGWANLISLQAPCS